MDVFSFESIQRNYCRLLELGGESMELIFPKGEEPKKTAKNSVAIGTIKREQEVEDGREKETNK